MTERVAQCCCGSFSITVRGDPHYVHRCHCDYCQRRTGSVFQVSCWYFADQIVARAGAFKIHTAHPNLAESYGAANIAPPSNMGIDYRFCSECGSTVYWEVVLPPGVFGASETVITAIAVGNFAEADFPAPVEDHFVRDRHHWVQAIPGAEEFDRLPTAHAMKPDGA